MGDTKGCMGAACSSKCKVQYYGRGYLQTTWRENYVKAKNDGGCNSVDIVKNPNKVATDTSLAWCTAASTGRLLFTKTAVPMVVILVTWATPSKSMGQRSVVRMQRTRLKLGNAIVIMLSSTTAMPRQNLGRIQFASQTWGRSTTRVLARGRLPCSSFFCCMCRSRSDCQ